MPSCAIFTCHNNQQKTLGNCTRYFPFPKNKALAESWYLACGRQDKINFATAQICSVHFDRFSYQIVCEKLAYSSQMYRALRDDAIPTLRLPQCVMRNEVGARLPRRARRHQQDARLAHGAGINVHDKRLHQGRRNQPVARLPQQARRNQPGAGLVRGVRRNQLQARLLRAVGRNQQRMRFPKSMRRLVPAGLPQQVRDHNYVRRAPERRIIVQQVMSDLENDDDDNMDFEDDDEDPLPPELSWMSYEQAIAMVKGLIHQVKRIKILSEKVKDIHEREKEMNKYLRLKLDKLYQILHARNLN